MLGLERLGFTKENITELKDPSWDDIHNAIMDLSTQIFSDFQKNLTSLLFVYFAGHG